MSVPSGRQFLKQSAAKEHTLLEMLSYQDAYTYIVPLRDRLPPVYSRKKATRYTTGDPLNKGKKRRAVFSDVIYKSVGWSALISNVII